MVQYLTKDNLISTIENNDVVLVDFYADWCGPCQALSPVLENIAEENKGAIIAKVNIDEQPELSASFGVQSIPALFYFKGGKLTDQDKGLLPKHILEGKLKALASA